MQADRDHRQSREIRRHECTFGLTQASDLGVAVNGDAVTECAGMQLPTVIYDKMDWWHSYWMLLYNQFNNNINIANRGPIYPEMTGDKFKEKVVEYWGQWYLEPKKRYKLAQQHRRVLSKFLALDLTTESTSIVEQGSKLDLVKFSNPTEVAVDRLWKIMQEAKQKQKSYSDFHQVEQDRAEIIKRINTGLNLQNF